MKENWRDVVGYEGLYEVSNLGRVRSHYGREIKYLNGSKNDKGYSTICLSKNGKMKIFLVHRLVYTSFVGGIPEGRQLDHINTIRDDNRLSNLRCVTSKENSNNPITAERMKEAGRRRAKDPKWRHRQREGAKRRSENQEWKNNVRKAAKKRSENQEYRNRQLEGVRRARAKAVLQLDKDTNEVIREWPSAADAVRELGISNASISQCCTGKQNAAGGYRWKFA